ncbi:hypothetical protein OESDEN_21184 [Oesophagostomum dentatum]|uniref:Leucine--tRNA ligase n=1 Tax=Oesophagostomum dentatum TaxID=61180 RepID=A0A0B1S5N6_OESDE|nr:hypothetical protein OESDEN_21184 [Oesophagostomum dentatum]
MNGRLHVGHTFTLSKCQFDVGYQRLVGERCLFPLGFRCTGMQTKTCTDRLEREMKDFGYPPRFPGDKEESPREEVPSIDEITEDKIKGRKSKLVVKTGSARYQWQIMQSIGMEDEEINKFASTDHWLKYNEWVVDSKSTLLAKIPKVIYLVAATLRPEIVYGQTNCYLHPDILFYP